MTKGEYEFFDHTADLGIRARGKTLSALFVRMACGLVGLIVEDGALNAVESRMVALRAEDPTSLLLLWLQDVLFRFSTERFLPIEYAVTVSRTRLKGVVRGERFEPMRHGQGREVKAITRHRLQVERRDGLWHGQVIVDI